MTDEQRIAQTKSRAMQMRDLSFEARNRLISAASNVIDARPIFRDARDGRWNGL